MEKLLEDEKKDLVFCGICGLPPGKHGLRVSRRFLGAGYVPPWARVHPGCDVRESKKAFIERYESIPKSER